SSTPFVIGACQPDPLIMLNRVRRASALDPRAIQTIFPDWWPLTDAEAVDFLKRAAEAADGILEYILHARPLSSERGGGKR
ncbi:hypothetical protein ACC713_37605, partial [Rhizobium johnstonii]